MEVISIDYAEEWNDNREHEYTGIVRVFGEPVFYHSKVWNGTDEDFVEEVGKHFARALLRALNPALFR